MSLPNNDKVIVTNKVRPIELESLRYQKIGLIVGIMSLVLLVHRLYLRKEK